MAIFTVPPKNFETKNTTTLCQPIVTNPYTASRLGKTTDITVSDEELKEENWKPVFDDLATKWPEVVRRFTIN